MFKEQNEVLTKNLENNKKLKESEKESSKTMQERLFHLENSTYAGPAFRIRKTEN